LVETTKHSHVSAWLQLLRVPNLLTVPGDPLVGFLLAGGAGATMVAQDTGFSVGMFPQYPWLRAAFAMAAALCLYMRGLITNDICDLAEDRADRPDRPLPSGRIAVKTARRAASVLGVVGMVLATLNGPAGCVVGLALVVTVFAYNASLKRHRALGPLSMGACRGLSVLLGAAAGGWSGQLDWQVLVPMGVVWAYIASVTAIAAGETEQRRIGSRRWLPLTVVALTLAAAIAKAWTRRPWSDGSGVFLAVPLLVLLTFFAATWAWLLRGEPSPKLVQSLIGRMIAGLLLLQAAMVVAAFSRSFEELPSQVATVIAPAILVLVWLSFPSASRRFRAS